MRELEEINVIAIPAVSYGTPPPADGDPETLQETDPDDPTKPSARERRALTALALLQTFHVHTTYILSRLSLFLPPAPSEGAGAIVLTPDDVLSFDLDLSGLDMRFVEWWGDEYRYRAGVRVVVRRWWSDLVGLVLGLGTVEYCCTVMFFCTVMLF
jgi:hypothetical protein